MLTVLLFLVILSLLVLVHEFGHFVAARKSGMRVYEFGLGFPPRMFGVYLDPVSKKWVWIKGRGKNTLRETVGGDERQEEFGATVYSVNWLPLGGFCKIKGESGDAANESDSFAAKSATRRLVVLVAGVVMNFLLAAILLGVGYMAGLPSDVSDGVPPGAELVGEPAVVVQQVLQDSPAAQVGIAFGDEVTLVNGKAVDSANVLMRAIRENGERPLSLEIRRAGQMQTFTVTPALLGDDHIPRLGILLADAGMIRYPWYLALPKGFAAAGSGLISIFLGFYVLIRELILGHGLAFDVSGPVGIASVVGQSARLGINYLINVTAMISLSLAALNILPIPALDGGRVLFILIEKVTRRPVPMRYEQLAHTIGFILLMVLIVVVTGRDIAGLL